MENSTLVAKVGEVTDAVRAGFERTRAGIVELTDRVEHLESVADRPRAAGDGHYSQRDNEHKTVFLDWMRNPRDPRRTALLSEAQHELEQKDVTIGTGAAGGFGLPKEISADIENKVRQLNPFRGGLVDEVTVGTNDFHSLVSMGDGTSGWSSEVGARTATASATLRDVAPTFGEQYALPTASNWSLQDLFFDVQAWLVSDVSADFAAQEATAIISGDGVSKPTGLLKNPPVATSDTASPMRNQDTLQFIPLTSAPSPLRLNIDSLIDLVGTVKERYIQETARCAFVMHRLTLAGLRKQKASTAGSYLWEPDSQAGAPPMLLGYRVLTCDAMPTNVAGNFPVLFGNFRRGYQLATHARGMTVIVDQLSVKGMTSFYVARRVGGRIRNCDALKAIKLA